MAYADPPYLGMCSMYQHTHGEDGLCWDELDTHRALIDRLVSDFPDGWALSLTSQNIRAILPLCPQEARIASWVKSFAAFRPSVAPAFAWEPVIFVGGRRKRSRDRWTGRDWVSVMPPVFSGECRDGLSGMKPERFCFWLFDDLLGLLPDDELVDLFHGSGAVKRAWGAYQRTLKLPMWLDAVDPQVTSTGKKSMRVKSPLFSNSCGGGPPEGVR